VTHRQEEAMTLGRRMAEMREGDRAARAAAPVHLFDGSTRRRLAGD
jgi:ABC-type Fe3+/spermidine/putrescine transport system ATPase subunit